MPVEMRTLIFSRNELTDALRDFACEAGAALPAGAIIYCSLADGPELEVTLKVVPVGAAEIATVRLGPEVVGAALVHYCIASRIPVPRRGERSLQAMGETVAMHFALNRATVRLPEFA